MTRGVSMDRQPGAAPVRRNKALSFSVLLAAVACGGSSTGPTKTEIFTGVFTEFGGVNSSTGYLNFELTNGHDADATLTWTVPAGGTRPIADLSFWTLGIPDRLQVRSAPSMTPPVTLRGSGSYVAVGCSNCKGMLTERQGGTTGIAPVPFTLTVVER
jgi:hypothetical protein